MQRKILHTLKVFTISIFTFCTNIYSFCQDNYLFTPPRTIYTNAFQNSDSSQFNKSILTLIKLHQPIYLNGSEINTDHNYILNQLKKHNTTQALTLNYYSKQYIITYSNSPNKIAYASNLFNYYTNTITKAIDDNHLPKSFQFIPLVCSGFNPLSNNQRGGSGFWHLNYAPAIKYGLTINEYVDERKDFKKSTQAATAYIKHLYSLYQNWELTLAAYSCGITTVNKILKRTESSTFWEIYPYLPEATRDIVPALTAMVYCYHEARNDNYLLEETAINRDTIKIDKKLHFVAIQHILGIDTSTLFLLNPTINQNIFPKGFNAIFPENSATKFLALKDSIYFYQDSILLKPKMTPPVNVVPKNGKPFTYKVKSGDILGVIAERFNVRVSQLQDWNNLNSTRINVGQQLTIYGNKIEPTQKKTVTKVEPTTQIKSKLENKELYTYTVKSGDNLWIIAKKYPGISAQDIMELNGIDENLKIGQVLKIKKK